MQHVLKLLNLRNIVLLITDLIVSAESHSRLQKMDSDEERTDVSFPAANTLKSLT